MNQAPLAAGQLARRSLRWRDLDWPVVIGVGLMHVGALAAPFTFSWSGLVVFLVLAWLTGIVGITLCYHRLLTHRSFKTPKWFEYSLTVLGCAAWQGSPVQWVGTHRIHHKHSDHEADPHTPRHGFTWSHVFWCMVRNQGALTKWTAAEAARDLCRDPGTRLIARLYLVPQFALAALCLLGGWGASYLGLETSALSWFIWGVCLRTVVVYHVTWFVNSAAHTWGYQSYATRDRSTNLWWVAVLSWGEGWHNNHHGDQRAAAHGRRWFEIDMTYWMIRSLALVGLAREIVPVRALMAGQARRPRRITRLIEPQVPEIE
jgi:stearoyl-CoA desaturase (delta-9 desaturase)